jgi:acyl-CoA synthetase (AMP-forming)/AMP-acid ligase II
MIKSRIENRLAEVIQCLVMGPTAAEKPFVLSQTTYGQIYTMAAHIRQELDPGTTQHRRPVCLATEDKGVAAAAVLSALSGGPPLIFPYAFSPQVLTELQGISGYKYAISDGRQPFPGSIREFIPRSDGLTWPAGGFPPADPDTAWIYLFTGGSTGTPQIWPKTVRNLLAETIRIVDSYGITPADRLVSTVSPLHIYGLLYYLLAALVANAAVTAATPLFPAEIEEEINRHHAHVLISVPAHYRALKSYRGKGFALRTAFSSAGVLAAEDAEAFSAKYGVGIIEVYGSTETGGVASRIKFQGQEDFTAFEPVDLKIEEENLWVRSAYISPGLTLDKEGYYQIGDRAVFTGPNRFKLMGRSDSIVKIGGKRVDLEDVRQVLKRHEDVSEALVIALPEEGARENQIAALVEGDLASEDLRPMMDKSLEPYARPRRIKVVNKIPITAAGKFDHQTITLLFAQDNGSAETWPPAAGLSPPADGHPADEQGEDEKQQ